MSSNHDDLASTLSPSPTPEPSLSKEKIFASTKPILRRRRVVRQVSWGGLLAACFVGGMITMHLLSPMKEKVVYVQAAPPKSPVNERSTPVSASTLEWQALENEKPSPKTYREAGDRYLAEGMDVASALRCYRRSLEQSPVEERESSTRDPWLLMALKDARRKEQIDAKPDF